MKKGISKAGESIGNFFGEVKDKAVPMLKSAGKKIQSGFNSSKTWVQKKISDSKKKSKDRNSNTEERKKVKKVVIKSSDIIVDENGNHIVMINGVAHTINGHSTSTAPAKPVVQKPVVQKPVVQKPVVQKPVIPQNRPSSSCNIDQLKSGLERTLKDSVQEGNNSKGYHKLRAYVQMIDDNGGLEILNISGEDKKRVASTQKIVTAYLLYKNRSKFRFPIKMSSRAKVIGTKGESIQNWNSIKDKSLSETEFFQAIFIASSNGASYRALEVITGSTSEYQHAKVINALIDSLAPANNTTFTNAHGLDYYSGRLHTHYSTPKDMTNIAAKIYADQGYRRYLQTHYSRSSYIQKGGITGRAGHNSIVYLTKNSGNCAGRDFSIFYSGLILGGRAHSAVMNYFR